MLAPLTLCVQSAVPTQRSQHGSVAPGQLARNSLEFAATKPAKAMPLRGYPQTGGLFFLT